MTRATDTPVHLEDKTGVLHFNFQKLMKYLPDFAPHREIANSIAEGPTMITSRDLHNLFWVLYGMADGLQVNLTNIQTLREPEPASKLVADQFTTVIAAHESLGNFLPRAVQD